jgi:hypothetical protein
MTDQKPDRRQLSQIFLILSVTQLALALSFETGAIIRSASLQARLLGVAWIFLAALVLTVEIRSRDRRR